MTGSGIGSISTAADGVSWAQLPAQYCRQVDIMNLTGVSIEFRQDGGGESLEIPTGKAYNANAITNLDQIEVRRVDQSTEQVAVKYRWEYR
jgi:hypothetical protein